jgi:hypothetical protein
MVDVKMPESIPCKFDARGWSPCKKPSTNGWCSKHEKLTCKSCSQKAAHSCDAGIGGLVCGAPLCNECVHSDGAHVTKKAAQAKRDEDKVIEERKVASRTNSERWIDEETGLPKSLFELLKGDWELEGYFYGKVFFLELEHDCLNTFPAILTSDTKRAVITSEVTILEQVWKKLDPRPATFRSKDAYINESLGILYLEQLMPADRENSKPVKLLTQAEFEKLPKTEEVFCWALGLLSNSSLTKEDFISSLVKQAGVHQPTFRRSL